MVVDGSVQADLALDRALEIACALPGSELLLLTISAPPSPWQVRRPSSRDRDVSGRVLARALARAKSSGVTNVRTRSESGEKAAVAASIAQQEACDHIFLPEHASTAVSRALGLMTGLGAYAAARRILSLSDVPVTVVAHQGTRSKA